MIPFIYITLHIFIAFTTCIIGFKLRRKECSHRRAEVLETRSAFHLWLYLSSAVRP